jgi:hypothetical protein
MAEELLYSIPRWLKIKMMGIAMGGMTAHQRK